MCGVATSACPFSLNIMRQNFYGTRPLTFVAAMLVVGFVLALPYGATFELAAESPTHAPLDGETETLVPVPADQAAELRQFARWEDAAAGVVFALKAGKLDEAYQCQRSAMDLATPAKHGDLRQARTIVLLGETHESAEKPDLAEQAYLDAIATGEQAVGRNDASLLDLLDHLANFYERRGRLEDASRVLARILRIAQGTPHGPPREVANRARNLAMMYERLGRRAESETLYRLTLTVGGKAGPRLESDLVQDMLTVSAFYRGWSKHDEALVLATRAEELATRVGGPNSMDIAFALDAQAAALVGAGRTADAEAPAAQALFIAEEQLGAESPDLAPRLILAAQVQAALHRKAEACAMMDRAIAITGNDVGHDSMEVAAMLRTYAAVLETIGDKRRAANRLRQAESLEHPRRATPTLAD